ncbi:MAG TPA: hypothetical protein PLP33_27825 [Leptospiraceae bacterium]|nr:hypothetical protein [Leptospiraceae bacterium]
MTFDTQKVYEKNLAEYQKLAQEHAEVEAAIKEFTEQAQAHLRQLSTKRDELFVAAKGCEKIILELEPYVKKEPEQSSEANAPETVTPPVAEEKKSKRK